MALAMSTWQKVGDILRFTQPGQVPQLVEGGARQPQVMVGPVNQDLGRGALNAQAIHMALLLEPIQAGLNLLHGRDQLIQRPADLAHLVQ